MTYYWHFYCLLVSCCVAAVSIQNNQIILHNGRLMQETSFQLLINNLEPAGSNMRHCLLPSHKPPQLCLNVGGLVTDLCTCGGAVHTKTESHVTRTQCIGNKQPKQWTWLPVGDAVAARWSKVIEVMEEECRGPAVGGEDIQDAPHTGGIPLGCARRLLYIWQRTEWEETLFAVGRARSLHQNKKAEK